MKNYVVPFCGGELKIIHHKGVAFVSVRHICKILGLHIPSRQAKFRRASKFWQVKMLNASETSGPQKLQCIPVHKVALWFSSMNTNKANSKIREELNSVKASINDAIEKVYLEIGKNLFKISNKEASK